MTNGLSTITTLSASSASMECSHNTFGHAVLCRRHSTHKNTSRNKHLHAHVYKWATVMIRCYKMLFLLLSKTTTAQCTLLPYTCTNKQLSKKKYVVRIVLSIIGMHPPKHIKIQNAWKMRLGEFGHDIFVFLACVICDSNYNNEIVIQNDYLIHDKRH